MPSTSPPRHLAVLGYYGFALNGWTIVLIPSLIRAIEPAFGQSDAAFGLLYLLAALAYALGAFAGGPLTERVGRTPVLTTGALALGAGLVGAALAPAWPLFVAAVALVDTGQGVIDGGLNGLVLDLFPHARGSALNRLHLCASVGGLLGPVIMGRLLTAGLSWRGVVGVTAAGALPLVGLLVRAPALPDGRHSGTAARRDVAAAERSLWPFAGLALAIGLLVAAQLGVSNWLVKLLVGTPVATATAILSLFYAGMALGRLLAARLAERVAYLPFAVASLALASLALAAAVLIPWLPVQAGLFTLAGLGYGPVYPLIMALGGTLYPRRLAALSGGLAGAATVGSVVYPPLMGLLAARMGLAAGMLGAALLGLPAALGLLAAGIGARRAATRARPPLRRAGRGS